MGLTETLQDLVSHDSCRSHDRTVAGQVGNSDHTRCDCGCVGGTVQGNVMIMIVAIVLMRATSSRDQPRSVWDGDAEGNQP